ncbi:DUF4158 domain-containing protein [Streptosporangium sp. NPDC087985]|uniref:DUF4158 domain-containing protein n=1 Tax=Streptosporangium sp. NPDC087985 TaxID=3366196 RepID=UPI003801DCCD
MGSTHRWDTRRRDQCGAITAQPSWDLEDLIECWTLDEAEFELVGNKPGATRLGFSLMLKFFELEARSPRREDVPKAAVDFVAGQVKVDPGLFAQYAWSGSTIEHHRKQIRDFYRFRTITVGDEDKLIVWLASDICKEEVSRDRLRAALLTRCREDKIEPPTPGQVERLLGTAEAMFERQFTTTTAGRLSAETIAKLEELIDTGVNETVRPHLGAQPRKACPGVRRRFPEFPGRHRSGRPTRQPLTGAVPSLGVTARERCRSAREPSRRSGSVRREG